MKENNTTRLARLALLLATLIWGSSFVVLKNTLDTVPILLLLAVRFIGAGVLLSAVFWKKLRLIDKSYLASGAIIGLFLFLAYTFQTYGLARTTPGKNAFLTAFYCMLVPFLFWITDKKRPDRYNIIAALMCITGIGLVSLTDSLTIESGDLLTLIGGFFFGAHIVVVAKFSKKKDPVLITILQFFYCGIFAAVGSILFETAPHGWIGNAWIPLLYMMVFCTGVTLLCQNWGQAHLPPSNAAILLSLESVFGVIFSVIIYHEALTPRLLSGFCLIFAATIVSETKLDFLKRSKPQKEQISR